jgi:hypothetical protein
MVPSPSNNRLLLNLKVANCISTGGFCSNQDASNSQDEENSEDEALSKSDEQSESMNSVDDVSLVTFYHFCEEPEFKQRSSIFQNITKFFSRNTASKTPKTANGEEGSETKLSPKILRNSASLPDAEYTNLLEDMSDIIELYNYQFFTMIGKLIVKSSLMDSNM